MKEQEILRTDQDDRKHHEDDIGKQTNMWDWILLKEMGKEDNIARQFFKGSIKLSIGGNQKHMLLNTTEVRYTEYICKVFLEWIGKAQKSLR